MNSGSTDISESLSPEPEKVASMPGYLPSYNIVPASWQPLSIFDYLEGDDVSGLLWWEFLPASSLPVSDVLHQNYFIGLLPSPPILKFWRIPEGLFKLSKL